MLSIFKKATRKLLLKYAPPEVIVLLKSTIAQYKSKTGRPFPHKNIYVTDSAPRGKVLVLSPHADDEAIGMGGALSMHLENQVWRRSQRQDQSSSISSLLINWRAPCRIVRM